MNLRNWRCHYVAKRLNLRKEQRPGLFTVLLNVDLQEQSPGHGVLEGRACSEKSTVALTIHKSWEAPVQSGEFLQTGPFHQDTMKTSVRPCDERQKYHSPRM